MCGSVDDRFVLFFQNPKLHIGDFLVVLGIYKLGLVFIRIFIRKSHIAAIKVSTLFFVVLTVLFEFLSYISLGIIDILSFLRFSVALFSNDLLYIILVFFYIRLVFAHDFVPQQRYLSF